MRASKDPCRARTLELLESALQHEPAHRQRFLIDEAKGDIALLEEVLALLDELDEADDVLPQLSMEELLESLSAARLGLSSGDRLGDYLLQDRLHQGPTTQVWTAVHHFLPARVAVVKVAASARRSNDDASRFRNEFRTLATLDHEHIGRIYDAGIVDVSGGVRISWFAMEYVRGAQDLVAAFEAAGLSWRAVVVSFHLVCDAVQHAHNAAVLHRDLKPSNILVGASGAPKLIDFGIARPMGGNDFQTASEAEISGTPAYMSPEQLCGEAAANRTTSDVYALGVLLYRCLAGRLPYEPAGADLTEFAQVVRSGTAPQPSASARALPADLDTVVMMAIAPSAEQRYQSAAALNEDLRRVLNHQPLLGRPPRLAHRSQLFFRRHRSVLSVVAVVLLLLFLAGRSVLHSRVQLYAAESQGVELRAQHILDRRNALRFAREVAFNSHSTRRFSKNSQQLVEIAQQLERELKEYLGDCDLDTIGLEASIDERLTVATLAIINGDPGRALELARPEDVPANPADFPILSALAIDVLLVRGAALSASKRAEECLAVCDEILALDSAFVWGHRNRALMLTRLERHEEAVAAYRRAIELKPEHANTQHQLGLRLYRLKQHEEALEHLRLSCELAPREYDFAYNTGIVLKELGQLQQALAELTRATTLNVSNPNVFRARGQVHRVLGAPQEAVEDFSRSLELEDIGEHASARFERAQVYAQLNEHERALDDMRRLLEDQPRFKNAHAWLGMLLRSHDQLEASLTVLDEGLGVFPDNCTLHIGRGRTLHGLQRFEEALAAFEAALVSDPDNASALGNRAATILDLGLNTAAVEACRAALELRPETGFLFAVRGRAQVRLECYEEGRVDLQRALELTAEGSEREQLEKDLQDLAERVEQASSK